MLVVHLFQEHDEAPLRGKGLDLFGRVPGRQEHTTTGAMLRQDAIIFGESLAARRDAERLGNFDDHARVGGTRSLPPLRVAPDETCDEGRVGDAGLSLILAEPQETAASRTVCVEIHARGELRPRSRRVWDRNGRGREIGAGGMRTDSLGGGGRIDAIRSERFAVLAFMPEVSPRFEANATIDGLFPQLTGNPCPGHRVPSFIAYPTRGRRNSSTAR